MMIPERNVIDRPCLKNTVIIQTFMFGTTNINYIMTIFMKIIRNTSGYVFIKKKFMK